MFFQKTILKTRLFASVNRLFINKNFSTSHISNFNSPLIRKFIANGLYSLRILRNVSITALIILPFYDIYNVLHDDTYFKNLSDWRKFSFICEAALCKRSDNIKYVPDSLKPKFLEGDIGSINHVPRSYFTKEIVRKLENCISIEQYKNIPVHLQSADYYLQKITDNLSNLTHVPDIFLNQKFYTELVNVVKDQSIISKIPLKYVTPDILEKIINNNYFFTQSTPDEFQNMINSCFTENVLNKVVNSDFFFDKILTYCSRYYDMQAKSYDVIKKLIEKKIENPDSLNKYLDSYSIVHYEKEFEQAITKFILKHPNKIHSRKEKSYPTKFEQKIWLNVLPVIPSLVKHVPRGYKNFITPEIWKRAVYDSPDLINLIPKSLIDKKMSKYVLSINVDLYTEIPEKFMDAELWHYVINNKSELISKCPEKFLNSNICNLAVNKNIKNCFNIPDRFKDPVVLEQLISESPKLCSELTDPTSEKIWKKIIMNDIKMIEYMPRKLINDTFIEQLFLKHGIEKLLLWVPGEAKQIENWLTKKQMEQFVIPYYVKNDSQIELKNLNPRESIVQQIYNLNPSALKTHDICFSGKDFNFLLSKNFFNSVYAEIYHNYASHVPQQNTYRICNPSCKSDLNDKYIISSGAVVRIKSMTFMTTCIYTDNLYAAFK